MSDPYTEELKRKVMSLLGFNNLSSPVSPSGGGGAGRGRVPGPNQGINGSYLMLPGQSVEEYEVPFLNPLSPAGRWVLYAAPVEIANNPAATQCLASGPPPAAAQAPAPAAAASGDPLKVTEGQVTFDAEGDDNESSIYFSRKVHWPGGSSGVTIGRGYDMGGRTAAAVKADMVAAGMSDADATAYSDGAGRKSSSTPTAKKWVDDNKTKLNPMSREVQKKLFQSVYSTYKTAARKNYNKWTKDEDGNELPGKVEFDKLDQAIRDILVDFVYQFWFQLGKDPMVKAMNNDYDELIKYIEETPAISQYEGGRRRAKFLRDAKKAKEAK